MKYNNLILEIKDNAAHIIIHRPEALNALNGQLIAELDAALDEILEDHEIWAAIITGEGRAFIAGADIAEMKAMSPEEGRRMIDTGQRLMNRIEYCDIPVIAAINGFALGGGLELAMACDFRIASNNAKFGQPETKLGIIPGYGGTQRLPRLVGKGAAKKLIYTGEMIDAQEAYRIGIVDQLTKPEELMVQTQRLAAEICHNAPIAIAMAKRAVNEGFGMELREAIRLEAERFADSFSTEDRIEGMTAFLESRKADFQNR